MAVQFREFEAVFSAESPGLEFVKLAASPGGRLEMRLEALRRAFGWIQVETTELVLEMLVTMMCDDETDAIAVEASRVVDEILQDESDLSAAQIEKLAERIRKAEGDRLEAILIVFDRLAKRKTNRLKAHAPALRAVRKRVGEGAKHTAAIERVVRSAERA